MAMGHAPRGVGVLCSSAVLAWILIVALSQEALSQEDASAVDAHARYSDLGADTCLGCHNNEDMLLIFRTPHGQGADPQAPFANLQCESCHGPGGDHAGRRVVAAGHLPILSFSGNEAAPAGDQNEVCQGCHMNDIGMPWLGSMHQRNDVACSNCHEIHKRVDLVTIQSRQADVCFDCHKKQKSESNKPYGHPIGDGQMSCTACHNPHHSTADTLLKKNTLNELCWSCHAEKRGPFLFEHPPASEDCSLCHNAHASIHPANLKRRPPLLCQACHSQAGHPSISFTSDSLAGGNNPSAFVVSGSCLNCHSQVHGSNHPSGSKLAR